mgnify:CR=1 FL=1
MKQAQDLHPGINSLQYGTNRRYSFHAFDTGTSLGKIMRVD